jgi:hypothetical protein
MKYWYMLQHDNHQNIRDHMLYDFTYMKCPENADYRQIDVWDRIWGEGKGD